MKDYPTPESLCPACGYRMDASVIASLEDQPPRPGDISLCGRCGKVMIFSDDLTLRRPTALERKIFLKHPMREVARKVITAVGVKRRENN
jgi:hypothetical protein